MESREFKRLPSLLFCASSRAIHTGLQKLLNSKAINLIFEVEMGSRSFEALQQFQVLPPLGFGNGLTPTTPSNSFHPSSETARAATIEVLYAGHHRQQCLLNDVLRVKFLYLPRPTPLFQDTDVAAGKLDPRPLIIRLDPFK